ncbi:MAG TPA: hypothetical protein PLX35_14050 [Cyclobacteriaceae bacterium]|nr:hypothetical protein [Cyclobacteriaceae bacterium]
MARIFCLLLMLTWLGCSKEPGSIPELLASFPTGPVTEMDPQMSEEHWRALVRGEASGQWTVTSNEGRRMKWHEAETGADMVVAVYVSKKGATVVIQSVNQQSIITRIWEKVEDSEWKEQMLPEATHDEFVCESAKLPDVLDSEGFDPNYVDVELFTDSMTYSANNWKFLTEVSNQFQSDAGLEDGYIQYYIVWVYGDEGWKKRLVGESGFQVLTPMKARIVEDSPDGPGIDAFDCPQGVTVTASAELQSPDGRYNAGKVLDGDAATGWAVGEGGIGAYVEFKVTEDFVIGTSYQIGNGLTKSKELWRANNRVQAFKVYINDRAVARVLLQDTDQPQAFSIDAAWKKSPLDIHQGDRIRFEIEGIYKGERYNDTVISYFVPTGNCG